MMLSEWRAWLRAPIVGIGEADDPDVTWRPTLREWWAGRPWAPEMEPQKWITISTYASTPRRRLFD